MLLGSSGLICMIYSFKVGWFFWLNVYDALDEHSDDHLNSSNLYKELHV